MARLDNVIIEDEVAKTTTDTSGTETIDLPEKGYLSQLNLRAAMLAQWVDESPLNVWQSITKVEVIVNGSQVVKSLDGRQIRALAWYHGIDLPPLGTYARGGSGDKTFWTFPIMFGRFPGDNQYMLDLSRYSNPQLKLTWNAAQSSFDGVSCDVTASPTFRYGLDGLIYRTAPPSAVMGYVKSAQLDIWATANSVTHRTEVPIGDKLLGLMVGGRYDSIDTPEFFDNIKLDFDNGQWVALDHGHQQLMAFYATHFPKPVETAIYQSISANDTFDPMVGFVDSLAYLTQTSSLGQIIQAGQEYPLYDYNVIRSDGGGSHTTRADVTMKFTGRLPHQCFYIPMHAFTGNKWEPIDTKSFGSVDLNVTMGSGVGTSATEKVVAEWVLPTGR